MKTLLLGSFFTLITSTAAFAQQKAIQKATIQTPNLQDEACKTRIENRMAHEDGISYINADYRHHTVTVKWLTDRTNIENIKTELANMGYDADDIKADPDAYKRLPITCQHLTHPQAKPK